MVFLNFKSGNEFKSHTIVLPESKTAGSMSIIPVNRIKSCSTITVVARSFNSNYVIITCQDASILGKSQLSAYWMIDAGENETDLTRHLENKTIVHQSDAE